jgi:hypothetical protein
MTIDCPLPHPSALLDNNGYMGSAWWACIKAVHERTGGAQGVSSKDMETAIGNEAATRAAADTALQAALNAEATARANGDSAEAAARAAADTFILTYAQQTNALLHETISRGAAPLDSPHFTGTPTAPTPSPGDNDTSLATTAFVTASVAGLAPLNSPAFTGNPVAPTPAGGDNDTSIATTAWVQAEVGSRFLPLPTGGVTWVAGVGAPIHVTARGSLFSQVDGGVGSTLWVSQGGGSWLAVSGV